MSKSQLLVTLERAVWVTVQNYGVATTLALIVMAIAIPWLNQWYLLYLGGVVVLIRLIAPYVEDWSPKPRVQTQGKAVFISGCDSGFGHFLAQRLDNSGLHVFAGCLFPENEGARSLKNSCSEKLLVVPLDVTSNKSVQNAAKYVNDNLGSNKFWAIVNNAGINSGAEVAWTSMDTIKSVFEVNTFGVMRTTKAFIPLLCKHRGRIVTVASAGGRYTLPGMVPYCMTKHAVISFCEGLRMEAYRFGVKVITIEPFFYKTPLSRESHFLGCTTNSWEDAPKEVKELYPEGYVEKYKRNRARMLKLLLSDKIQEVVDCMEEAILAIDPKYVYSTGNLVCRFIASISSLPKPVADRLIHEKSF